MARFFIYVLWLIQLVCIGVILSCAWLLLERQLFALVAAGVVLLVSLYLENTLPPEGVARCPF